MTLDYRTANLPALITDMETISAEVTHGPGSLTEKQLNWKPNADEWSVAQCFQHILVTNERYVAEFDGLLSGFRTPTLAERLPILPRLSAAFLLRALNPDAPMKIGTSPAFEPTASALDPGIVSRFQEMQQQLIQQMRALQSVDASRLMVTSPFASFVAYSALDACRIIVAHERVHLNQATRVTAAPGYPDR